MRSKLNKAEPSAPIWLKTLAYAGLVFLHFPIAVILINAFVASDANHTYFTLKWFSAAFARDDVISAILLSLKVATVATFIALIMGTMAAAALYRRNFFGKEAITTMLILPIALPGIITGIALLSAMNILAIDPGFWTIAVSYTHLDVYKRQEQYITFPLGCNPTILRFYVYHPFGPMPKFP